MTPGKHRRGPEAAMKRFKNAEPSDAVLLFGRVTGVIVVLFGIAVPFL